MKVLFVYSANRSPMPFVNEQKESLIECGIDLKSFEIRGQGFWGYMKYLKYLRKVLKKENFDIVHAHYGLAGLISIMQLKTPVVVTFHGSDIYLKRNKIFSFVVSRFTAHNVFVSKKMHTKLYNPKHSSIIPCGVDLSIFKPIEMTSAKSKLKLNQNFKYVLFSSSFSNPVKNYPLAKAAIESSIFAPLELIELKNMSREQVNLYLNASELLLVTSFTEGSPQVIKEALASNTPIVSTNVGDVEERIKGVTNSFVSNFNANELALHIDTVISNHQRTNGLEHIRHLGLKAVAIKIVEIYKSILLES